MWASLKPLPDRSRRRGFTIVELLIVIVIIGILATIVIVAYNGIQARADEASLQSEIAQLNQKVLVYKATNSDALPTDATTGGLSVASNHQLYYRVTPDGKNYCLAANLQNNPTVAYSLVSTQSTVKKGTCQGYILVPGSASLGTSDFWVMKYEAKNVNGLAYSQAANSPWVSISQTDAISTSQSACDGCHLTSEAEWLTLAQNVLGVPSNWSGGSVGSGYIYSGHNDNAPGNSLAADTNDANGYSGETNTGGNQRRTLTLSNGEVIWDLAGNVSEWTTGAIGGSQQPGFSGETAYAHHEYNSGSLLWNGLPSNSRPGNIYAGAGGWSSSQGIGMIHSNYGETASRAFYRGGMWSHGSLAGVLMLGMDIAPSYTGWSVGFRVAM
jgi:prepilin-type N-terminal cleavage/methylation domain-containing protein